MRKNKRTEKHRELKRTAERWLTSLGFDVYHEQFVYCREPEKGYKSRHRIDLVGVNSSGLKMGVECGLISRLVICETKQEEHLIFSGTGPTKPSDRIL